MAAISISRIITRLDVTEDISEEDLPAFLAERLVRYKIPRSIEFVQELLRDDAGKIRRFALLQERVQVQR